MKKIVSLFLTAALLLALASTAFADGTTLTMLQRLPASYVVEDIPVITHVEHGDDTVEVVVPTDFIERLRRCFDMDERGRVADIKLAVLEIYQGFDVPVLFENVFIVTAAHKKYLVNAVLHECRRLLLSEIEVYNVIEFHFVFQR